jgi:hypothetical protein
MESEPDARHIADVRLLSRGYVAFCSTCEWVGPEHRHAEPAVQDARAHEQNPIPAGPDKVAGFRLRRIRRRR